MILLSDRKYKVGLYIRLSREDGDDLESESISNQRSLLKGYLTANKTEAVDEYIDDGYSGGNFDRPGFKKLISDVEAGKIDCIITKDLSRLGRDYIDTGRYIERYFPENNIRYIAINDDVDTFNETSASDMMPFKLGMNDMYAKDISKKVRSALIAKKKDGLFLGASPCYGYRREPNNKHHLIPNPETAPIVKKIFDLYLAGYSTSSIALALTKEEVPTPIMIKNSYASLKKTEHPEIWKHTTVSNILRNKVYTGCLIQRTSQNVSYKSKKRKKLPESEWIVTENAHEPIISKQIYKKAQTIRDKSNTYSPSRRDVQYLLGGMVFCKDCGSRMGISYDRKRDRVTMKCNNYRRLSKYGICFSHYVSYSKLEATVLSRIREMCFMYLKVDKFESKLQSGYVDPSKAVKDKINATLANMNKLEQKIDKLYDDKFNDVISEETYKRLSKKVEDELEHHKNKLEEYKTEKKNVSKTFKRNENYKQIVENFLNMKNPTKEMINKIIYKIEITKDKKVEIHYNIRDFNYLKTP